MGNYLAGIVMRMEEVNLTDAAARKCILDDLILRAAVWQDQRLRVPAADKTGAAKVVLLSFDRDREPSLSFWRAVR
jgi:hypothetical protein